MSPPSVTLNECARIVGQLEPRLGAPSYWQLRALDDRIGAVDSRRVVLNHRATTRLLDPLDVALVRLWWRMVNTSLQPQWMAGAVLAKHRDELRQVLSAPEPRVLIVRGLRSQIADPAVALGPGVEVYPLADVPAGVLAAIEAIRETTPNVWNGCRRSRVADLQTVPSSELCEVM